MPELWHSSILMEKQNAIAEYEKSLMAAPARLAPMLEHALGFREENQECDDFPEIPRKGSDDPEPSELRPKTMDFEQSFPSCIVGKAGRKEFSSESESIEAMDKEWKT
jgi:hypothetical protein